MEEILYYLSVNMTTVILVLIAVLIIALFILTIYDLRVKKKQAQEASYFNYETPEESYDAFPEPTDNIETEALKVELEPVTAQKGATKDPIKEIRYVEEDPELEKTQAKLELEKLKEELAKAKEQGPIPEEAPAEPLDVPLAPNKIEEAEKPLETFSPIGLTSTKEEVKAVSSPAEPPAEDEINAYESQQEEDAIISMDELSKVMETRTTENAVQDEDESIPISIDELYATATMPTIKLDDFETIKEKVAIEDIVDPVKMHKTNNVSIVSPIFGRLEEESQLNLEDTADLEKLNLEIRKTNEFLSKLKELQNKLN